ncbi:MAG: NAD(P)H-binding protein [Rikenellaceae bacterium]|nr:NAD(P)H-binding protein [Rikenellaceae bacterium]
MKKIAIIGATGFVGSAITAEALSRGYRVRAIVRDRGRLPADNNIEGVECDIADTDSLIDALRGYETVISAYNPGWSNPDIYEQTLSGYRSIVRAAIEARTQRLLIVGGAGSLYVEPGRMLMDTGTIPPEILPGVRSLARVYTDILPEVDTLDWVFFCPAARLQHGSRTGNYRTGRDEIILNVKGDSVISVEDYAKEMLDEAETKRHHRERFTIGYKDEDPTHPRKHGVDPSILDGI